MTTKARLAALLVATTWLGGCVFEAPSTGVSREPIVGGRPAGASDIHSTVALYSPSWGAFCTGTLIAPTVVLTAAHCVYDTDEYYNPTTVTQPGDVTVLAGLLNATSPSGGAQYRVERVAPHAGYTGDSWDYDAQGMGREDDIAILVLAEPVTEVPPAPVLPMERVDDVLANGTMLTISGYGLTAVDDYGRAIESSSAVLNIAQTEFRRQNGHELLAGNPGTPDSCFGDSGGPAYVSDDGVLYVVGVTSRARADSTAECGAGGIYTLASAYTSELESLSGGAFPPPEASDCSHLDDVCTVGRWNPTALRCESAPASDGTACDDDLFCTIDDQCRAGLCEGQPRQCDAGADVYGSMCDEELDRCVGPDDEQGSRETDTDEDDSGRWEGAAPADDALPGVTGGCQVIPTAASTRSWWQALLP